MQGSLPQDPFIFEEDDLPDISFRDYAHQQGLDASYDAIIEAIAGDQGASASALSAYWNNKEEENWVWGNDDFKFKKTYFDLIDTHIAQPVLGDIEYSTIVTRIAYSSDTIQVTDASGKVSVSQQGDHHGTDLDIESG